MRTKALFGLICIVLSITFSFCLMDRERYELLKSEASFDVVSYEEYSEKFKERNFEEFKKAGEFSYQQELSYLQTSNIEEVYSNQSFEGSVRQLQPYPDFYDTRSIYPACFADIIRDQMNCGGCWSFATNINFSERYCFSFGGKFLPVFSPQWSISCDKTNLGCQGGNRILAWEFLQREGSVSEYCVPFTSGDGVTGTCPSGCSNPAFSFSKYYPNKTKSVRILRDLDSVKSELMKGGPVTAGMQTYDDLFLYNGGSIYRPSPSAQPSDRHSVIIVGWGNDRGKTYFIIQNSWGKTFGEDGYFKMYTDACDIMSLIVVGDI